jgi:hypothetical protein
MAGVAVEDFSREICYGRAMKWLQWNPDWADTAKVLGLVLVIVIFVAVFAIWLPSPLLRSPNASFGPDWDCVPQARGEPVCTKKPGH